MASGFQHRGNDRNCNHFMAPSVSEKSLKKSKGKSLDTALAVKKKRSCTTVTYRSMEIAAENMFQRTKLMFGHVLKDETIRQIYAYARSIPTVGTTDVDKTIFDAQMMRWFDITNTFILQRMYQVIAEASRTKRQPIMNVEQYVKLICTFISDDIDIKIRFAFDVYDTLSKGELDKRDYETLLEQVQLERGSDEAEALSPQTLVLLVLAMCDLNGDGKIDHDEFSYLVQGNKLLMQCLGHCLPEQILVENFMQQFGDKTALEVRAFFRDERRTALRGPALKTGAQGVQKYYPIPLDLP